MKTFYSYLHAYTIAMLFSCNLLVQVVCGQGWEKTFGGGENDAGVSVIQTSDSGFVIVGYTYSFGAGDADLYLIKTDFNGNAIWKKGYGGNNYDNGNSVQSTTDGGYIITGSTESFGQGVPYWPDLYIIKVDSNGFKEWQKAYGGISKDVGNSVLQTDDGGFIVAGFTTNVLNNSEDVFLLKTDSIGDTIWTKTFDNSFADNAFSIQKTSDGGYIIAGYTYSQVNSWDIYIVKTDINGDSIWTRSYGGIGDEWGFYCQQTNDSGFIISGYTSSFGDSSINVFLIKTDSYGDTLWTRVFGGPGYDVGYAVKQTDDGGYIIAGYIDSIAGGDVFLIKTDNNGILQWTRNLGGANYDLAQAIIQTFDGGYIIAGYTESYGIGNGDVYLIKTDSLGNAHSNLISGNSYTDSNTDCTNDSNDLHINNRLIQVTPGPQYASTNSNGYYSLLVDTGTYTIESISPNSYYQQTCDTLFTITFTNFYDTSANNNFANEIIIYCPLMTVDISTWALRPCMQSIYSVQFCNNGTTAAGSAYTKVEFDNDITPVSSTLALTSQVGNIYTFNIGTVQPNQCGYFYVTADVSCTAALGSTHCVEAHIFPDSICLPIDSVWDHSSISVEGICSNDSLACFTIYNAGDAMQGSTQWRIYENNQLIDTGYFLLGSGDSLIICRAAQGLTIRLEADQRPGHPGNSHPNATIELCGGIPPGAMGFIVQMPEDDADEFVETDCREITASYDPNEKLVKPSGVSENHFIDSTDNLEYQVNFQNTGTDTAFKIVVRDTISAYLDITSVQCGASSHPYTFRIYGQGILEWTFNDILLPDSNTNEALSHGFVRYKIRQNPGNMMGTTIENRAAIYFDYNAPVITNTSTNTVWKEFLVSSEKIYASPFDFEIFPNPFLEKATLRIINPSHQNSTIQFSLYTMLGEKLISRNINGEYFFLERSNLSPGMYIIKITSGATLLGAARIVAG